MANPAVSTLAWLHTDGRGIGDAVTSACTHAVNQSWVENSFLIADIRAFLIACLATAANTGATPVTLDATKTATIICSPGSGDRNVEAQFALINAVIGWIMAKRVSPDEIQAIVNLRKKYRLITVDDDSAQVATVSNPIVIGVGAAAVIGAALVASSGVLAGALVWMNGQDRETQYNIALASEKTKQHAKTLEESRAIIENHLEAEHNQGQSIPWSQVELQQIEKLNQSTKEITGWQAPPLQSVPDAKIISQAAAGAITDIGQGVKTGIETTSVLIPLAVAAGIAYALSQ